MCSSICRTDTDAKIRTAAVGVDRRDDFRAALSAVLVSREDHLPLFEQAFALYWRDPRRLGGLMGRGGQDAGGEYAAVSGPS